MYPCIYHLLFFFSLTQVKYGILTFEEPCHCGVVVKPRFSEVSRSGSTCAACFHSFSSEPCITVRIRAAMPALEIANRSTKKEIIFRNFAAWVPMPYKYSYNWLFSRQSKNRWGKSSSGLLFTTKILHEAMYLASAYLGQITNLIPKYKILNLFRI